MKPSSLPLPLLIFLLPFLHPVSTSSLSPSIPRSSFFSEVLSSPSSPSSTYCKPTGQIQDACCDFETVEQTNHFIFNQLHSLVSTPYFRFYKVDLFKECPFWQEDGSCMNRACAVETVEDEEDVPEAWRAGKLSEVEGSKEVGEEEEKLKKADEDSSFCVLEDEDDSDGQYVDLLSNPERFTGYSGASSSRVWKAIYEENCFSPVGFIDPSDETTTGFAPLSGSAGLGGLMGMGGKSGGLLGSLAGPRDVGDEEVCLEKRVFYRIVSGLHASISIHICDDYLDQSTGKWSPNLKCFITRIGQHPERLQNVYFTYVVALRALAKSGPLLLDTLAKTSSGSGNITESGSGSQEERSLLEGLIEKATNCQDGFDEGQLFTGIGAKVLKAEFSSHFKNISSIMDCVGCDKCRLWGKLQITGLGTALKLLFSEEGTETLSRSEMVSFLNVLHRLSESLEAVDRFRELWKKEESGEGSEIEGGEEKKELKKEEKEELEKVEVNGTESPPTVTTTSTSRAEVILEDEEEERPRSSERASGNGWKKFGERCREGWRACWDRFGIVGIWSGFGGGEKRSGDEL